MGRASHPISPLEGEMPGRAEGGMVRHPRPSFALFRVAPPSVSFADISPSRGESGLAPRQNPREKPFPSLPPVLSPPPLSEDISFRRATLTRRPVGSLKIRRSASATRRDLQGRTASDPDPQARAASLNRLRRQTGSQAQPGRRAIRSPSGESFRGMCQIQRRPRPLMTSTARYEGHHQALLPPEPVVAGPSGDGRTIE